MVFDNRRSLFSCAIFVLLALAMVIAALCHWVRVVTGIFFADVLGVVLTIPFVIPIAIVAADKTRLEFDRVARMIRLTGAPSFRIPDQDCPYPPDLCLVAVWTDKIKDGIRRPRLFIESDFADIWQSVELITGVGIKDPDLAKVIEFAEAWGEDFGVPVVDRLGS